MRTLIAYLFLCTSALAQVPSIPATGNFVYIDQVGDGNIIDVTQMDAGIKQSAIIVKGDNNFTVVNQSGAGNNTAIINNTNNNATSSNNILSIVQQGSGNHSATIQLTDPVANNNNDLRITQKGNAPKQFTLQAQGSGITAFALQDNLTTPDTGSMSIICLAPPCTGYSYVRH